MQLKHLILFTVIIFSAIACANEEQANSTEGHSGGAIEAETIDEIKLPPKKENPAYYWKIKKMKIQAGEVGYLRSSHSIPPSGEEVDPRPVNITRKEGKILSVAVGDYNMDGYIVDRTGYFFENEQLVHVEGDSFKLFIHGDTIYQWLNNKDEIVQKDPTLERKVLDSLKQQLHHVMKEIGVHFARDQKK